MLFHNRDPSSTIKKDDKCQCFYLIVLGSKRSTYYHKKYYFLLFILVEVLKCHACETPITENTTEDVQGNKFHWDCLRCTTCGSLVNGSTSCLASGNCTVVTENIAHTQIMFYITHPIPVWQAVISPV